MCILLMLSGCSYGDEPELEYDNNISADLAISKTYTEAEISNLQSLSFNDIKSKFNLECIRKTFQGYYIVLKMENGGRTFLFLNMDLNLKKVISVDEFYKSSDFSFVNIMKTTFDDIINFDLNATYYPVSVVDVTGHILSDGFMLIQYERVVNGVLVESPVVKSIEFTSNADMEGKTDAFWIQNAPFILLIDKIF